LIADKPGMDNRSDIITRKKISLHAKILAVILFVSLGSYALMPVFRLPSLLYMLFPVWIWGRIAITDGSTYLVVSSILLLMACTVPLFLWGHTYPKKAHYARRLRIWFILFSILLGYAWLMPIVAHISAILPAKTDVPIPAGAMPIGYEIRDSVASREAKTPPVHSAEFVVFLVVLVLYTVECIWVHTLLTKAQNQEKWRNT
jgi:hypothetical protein